MPGFGWGNPWPLEWGGGTSLVERTYLGLRSAAGKGGSAPNEDTSIDGLWRQVRARGLTAAAAAAERAALQALPTTATDALPYYEELFRLAPGADAAPELRQERAAAAYTRRVRSDVPAVLAALLAIDPRFSILEPATTTTTQAGRGFEDHAGAEPYSTGAVEETSFPNFSTDDIVFIRLDLGGSLPGPAEEALLERARAVLDDLPAWVDFVLMTGLGFHLDVDPLDLTGLSP